MAVDGQVEKLVISRIAADRNDRSVIVTGSADAISCLTQSRVSGLINDAR